MSSNTYEDNEVQDSQSTFEVDVGQSVPQVEKEIVAEGKNSFGAREKMVFKVDADNVGYFDSRSSYFTWDLELTNAGTSAGYVLPNALAGAGAGFVQTFTTRAGTGEVLSQIPNYNIFHSMLHPHTCNDANGNVRALQDFSFGASAGEGGRGKSGWDLAKQPFWTVSTSATGARTNQKVKVCWRPYNGLLNNYGHSSKVVPNTLFGGLQFELETEEVTRCLFPAQTTIKNLRPDLYYRMFETPCDSILSSSTGVPAGQTEYKITQSVDREVIVDTSTPIAPTAGGTGYAIANNVATTVAPAGGTGLVVNIRTVGAGVVLTWNLKSGGTGYSVGDVITFTAGNTDCTYTLPAGSVNDEGAVGTASSKAIYRVGDGVHLYGDLNGAGVALHQATTIAAVACNNTTGEIKYTLSAGPIIPADQNLTTITLRSNSDLFTGMTYTISNPKLILRQCVLNPAQQNAYNQSLKRADGSLGYEFVDIAQVKKTVNRNELVSQMDIPTLSTRCLGVVSQPQDNSLLNNNREYGCIDNAWHDEESYQYLIMQRLQPNRKVDVGHIGQHPQHIYELTKALTQSGVDVQRNHSRNLKWSHAYNSAYSALNFKIGRAIGEWSNSVDLSSDGSLALVVNYSAVGRAFDQLWTHYLFHKKIATSGPQGVRVSY